MTFYQVNWSWSDQFLPEIRRIVGGHLLKAAPDPLDHFQATDLVMLDAKDMRVAARVRRPGYSMLYPNQFTIRAQVQPSRIEPVYGAPSVLSLIHIRCLTILHCYVGEHPNKAMIPLPMY